jgi:hypothetical protein
MVGEVMRIRIDTEGHPEGLAAAIAFAKTHVIVSRAHLNKIKRWAKRRGLYAELKALGVEMQEIEAPESPERAEPDCRACAGEARGVRNGGEPHTCVLPDLLATTHADCRVCTGEAVAADKYPGDPGGEKHTCGSKTAKRLTPRQRAFLLALATGPQTAYSGPRRGSGHFRSDTAEALKRLGLAKPVRGSFKILRTGKGTRADPGSVMQDWQITDAGLDVVKGRS